MTSCYGIYLSNVSISQSVQLLFIAQMQFPQNLHRTSDFFSSFNYCHGNLPAISIGIHLSNECVGYGVYPSASPFLHPSSLCVCVCVCGLFVCERRMTCLLVEGSSCALDLVCVALPCPVIASRLLAAASAGGLCRGRNPSTVSYGEATLGHG